MNNPRYTCPIPGCPEVRACKDIVKHILRHSSEELIKGLGEATLKGGTRGQLVLINTLIDKKKKEARCCFSCDKIFIREGLYMDHIVKCKLKPEHKLKCKSILEPKKGEAEPEPEWVTVMKNMIEQIPENKGFLELNYPEVYATCCKN